MYQNFSPKDNLAVKWNSFWNKVTKILRRSLDKKAKKDLVIFVIEYKRCEAENLSLSSPHSVHMMSNLLTMELRSNHYIDIMRVAISRLVEPGTRILCDTCGKIWYFVFIRTGISKGWVWKCHAFNIYMTAEM